VHALKWSAIVIGILAAIGGATYWWATGSVPSRAEEPSWLTSPRFAHRGLHPEGPQAPENSLAAFERAADAGLGFELDVQLTADGHPVIMHDPDLERMTGDSRLISEVTLADLEPLRLAGGTQPIPTLAEALAVAKGRVPVLVEIKNEGEVGELEDAVAEELADFEGEVAVISFNPYSLARVSRTQPDIVRGQLSSTFEEEDLEAWKRFLLSNLLMNWSSKPDFIAYEISALPNTRTSIQKMRGRPLLGWTPATEAELTEALRACDNAICDPGALASD